MILGVVEGLTEYLLCRRPGTWFWSPRCSLGQADEASAAFNIVIQLGAILAVLVVYGQLLQERAAGLLKGEQRSKDLLACRSLWFLPAAANRRFEHKAIKEHLFGPVRSLAR